MKTINPHHQQILTSLLNLIEDQHTLERDNLYLSALHEAQQALKPLTSDYWQLEFKVEISSYSDTPKAEWSICLQALQYATFTGPSPTHVLTLAIEALQNRQNRQNPPPPPKTPSEIVDETPS